MYKLTILKQNGEFLEIKSSNLKGLKDTAKSYNKQGCSVEITQEVVLFRIVQK